MKKLENVKWAD